MIVVPQLGAAVSGSQDAASVGVVNINTATEAELDSLPGIGEVRAGRILASRQDEGPFASTDDLLTRELVPESVFEDIAQLITVN
jgi:competence protein ComEA